jgi:hypothetical protein
MTIFRHRLSGPGAAGDVWTTTLHSQSASTLANAHTAFVTLVSGFITTTLAPMWPNDISANSVITDQLDATTGKNVSQTSSTVSLPGTGAGATLPGRDALVIGLRTASSTRRGRGRMFWPAPDSTHLTAAGLLLSADATSIASAFAARLNTFKSVSIGCIWHDDLKSFDNIVTVTVGNVLGTQRRRTNKVVNSYASATV